MTIEDLIKRLDDHERRIQALEGKQKTLPAPLSKNLSIKEFILSKKPNNDVVKTLVIGYYFEKYEGLTSFNTTDLEKGFVDAKEKTPANINDCVYKNIKKGLMMEAKENKENKKAWQLTNSGEKTVEDLKAA
jgi:hypothetical protein